MSDEAISNGLLQVIKTEQRYLHPDVISETVRKVALLSETSEKEVWVYILDIMDSLEFLEEIERQAEQS